MEGTVISKKTYRYFTWGNAEKATKLVYVLHGYGQLAEYFIRKFHVLPEEYFIVAPEGMHRFYLKGSSGRVGASWRTKEARESDIKDTINWLDELNQLIYSKYIFDKKIILGFSQGGATAARWQFNGRVSANHLILWASVFPPDLQLEKEVKATQSSRNYFLIGKKDEYFSEIEQQKMLEFYSSINYESIQYDGNHDINENVLLDLIQLV
jgi:predicted esterase